MNENLIKDWTSANTRSERAKLIKKYDLQVGVSRLRPGEVKLGIANELKMNHKKEIPALDLDGELIIVSGNPPKIKYPMKVVDLPEGLFGSKIKRGAYVLDKDGTKGTVIFVKGNEVTYIDKQGGKHVKSPGELKYLGQAGAVKEEALELGTDKALKNHIDNTPGQKEIEETLQRRALGDYKSTVELIKKEIPSYMDPKIMPHVAAFLSVQFKKSLDDVKRDLQPVTESIETEWLAGSIQKRKDLIKKYDLKVGISSVRPGEVKLGISNELNGRKEIYALDGKNKLIVVSGTAKAPKIRYVKENKEETIKSIRLHAIVQIATGEKNPTIREAFLESGQADLTSTLGVIDSFRTFFKESTSDLLEVHLKWDTSKGDPAAFIRHHKLDTTVGMKNTGAGRYIFTSDEEGMIEFLKAYDDGANDFTRNSEWNKLLAFYGTRPATRGFPKVAEVSVSTE